MYMHNKFHILDDSLQHQDSCLELKITTPTSANGIEIPSMRTQISIRRVVARIAGQIDRSSVFRDIVRRWYHTIRGGNVVLGGNMYKAQ